MLIAIFLIAILVLSLAVAAPRIAKSIQRDRDLETWHRGMQYRRAVQLYYRKFRAYPPNIDALVNTSNIRFLRKKYPDPLTGQEDWKPIMFGQNKTPTVMGFFGQPLAGNASTLAGIGPSGGNGGPGAPGGSAFGGSGSSIFGSSGSDASTTQSTSSSTTGPSDNSGGSSGSTSSGGTTSTGSSSGPSGPTFGGAGIIGFEPASPKQSILVYKKKNHYAEWEFTYDPLSEMRTVGNAGLIGQPAGGTQNAGAPGFNSSSSGSSGSGSSGSGGSGSGGSGSGSSGSGSSPGSNPTPPPMPPDTSAPQ
jgi:type II secretory pathway pseudopilin PulG